MATDDDMDDAKVIAARYVRVAKKVIEDTAEVAQGAFKKLDPVQNREDAKPAEWDGPYTAGDAIKDVSRLMTIAARGAIGLARVPLQTQPNNRPLLLADHLATVAARSISDIDQVAHDAAALVDAEAFGRNQWVDSAVKLSSIAMIRGAEVMETVGAGPGRYRNPVMKSDEIAILFPADEAISSLRLELISLSRPKMKENIAKLARFVPKDGIVRRAEDASFRLVVNAAGIPSGLYTGEVQAHRRDVRRTPQSALR